MMRNAYKKQFWLQVFGYNFFLIANLYAAHEVHNAAVSGITQKNLSHGRHTKQHESHGMYGPYPMSRESSGTSWIPQSTPYFGFHTMHKEWMLMFQGYSYLVYDHQAGPRGGDALFDENMFMVMGQRDFGRATFAFRTMISLEPLTIGKCGYPLLLQNGETCDGITPLIDRQHPHDLFDELALVYTYSYRDDASLFFYLGYPGEPALGPPVYYYRFSAYFDPQTPISHHWIDSTHITFGVATVGFVWKDWKFEYSLFTGREPDEHRFDFERPRFDSSAFRISYNPTADWALQISYGILESVDKLEPHVNIDRFTASAIYNKAWCNNNWQTSAIIGINRKKPGRTSPAFLFESTVELHTKHVIFGCFEAVKKDELLETEFKENPLLWVAKGTMGYVYEFLVAHHMKWGIGGLVSGCLLPPALESAYKKTFSYMLFLQMRLV